LASLRSAIPADPEAALAARAAWLYFAGGRTQAEVADALHVPNTKAHRLIARASRDGLIRVFVEGPIAGCVALEETLKERHGLAVCEVVPDVDDAPLPLRTLGTAGARFIRTLIEMAEHRLIGIGHGRTLAAAADHMPSVPANGTRFVSLLGGLTRRFAANPFDVIHRLAERTGAEAYLMPVPFFANSVEDKSVMLAQAGVREAVALGAEASLSVAGIGEVTQQGFIASLNMVSPSEMKELNAAGAVGEIFGHFFDAAGREIPNSVSDRAMAPEMARLRQSKIVAIAGGTEKIEAIRSVLASGLLHGLITDEATAARLVSDHPGGGPGKKNGNTVKANETNHNGGTPDV
jgi:DNA-binding transcriptional regulator LsrR (DeoR family)